MKNKQKLKNYTITKQIVISIFLGCIIIFTILGVLTGIYLKSLSSTESIETSFNFLLTIYIVCSLIFTIIFSAVSFIFMKHQVHDPILFLKWLTEKMSKGDFTFVVNEKRIKKDEFGEVIVAQNNVVLSMRVLIDQVYDSLNLLTNALSSLGETIDQSYNASSEILKSSEDIANSATEQAMSTENGLKRANDLGNQVKENNEIIQNVDDVSQKILKLVDEGMHHISNLSDKVYETDDSINKISEVISKTNESATNIKQASDIISSIADQTNLLALNAAIEASRAGEAGKGFAVVAEEIRVLAEQSTESTKRIDSIIKELQGNSNNAMTAMEQTNVVIQKQVESVVITKNKFEEINESMSENQKAVNYLKESSRSINIIKEDILKIMNDLAAIAETNAAGTEQSIASIQEQTSCLQNLSMESEKIYLLNEDLNDVVSNFKTKKAKKKHVEQS